MERKKKSETIKSEINESGEKPEIKKVRRDVSGPIRNKARTRARLVAAVGKVIQKNGYTGLNAKSIAVAAGVDRKLVPDYFGNVNNLIEEYIEKKDFWKSATKGNISSLLKSPEKIGHQEIAQLLQSQFNVLMRNKALQKIIHWELSEPNEILRNISDRREEIGEELFSSILPDFDESVIDLRARFALLIGGIYYLTLHAKSNGSKFCGIDINEEEGKLRIENEIRKIIVEAYEIAGVKK